MSIFKKETPSITPENLAGLIVYQFWRVGDVSPRTRGRYAPRRYQSKEEMRAAFTTSATRAARFFGISEKLLPCTVIISLRDRRRSPCQQTSCLIRTIKLSRKSAALMKRNLQNSRLPLTTSWGKNRMNLDPTTAARSKGRFRQGGLNRPCVGYCRKNLKNLATFWPVWHLY